MMHSDKIVVAIKVNGRILRESGDTVSLPFGSEFTLFLKNLNSVRASVAVSIDGKDATEGHRLILAPNSSLELERFIKNGNLHAGNRFKFIERTAGIENHRGIGAEDGLIRVEAQREKVETVVHETIVSHHYDEYWPHRRPLYPWPLYPSPFYPFPWLGSIGSSVSYTASNSSDSAQSSAPPRRDRALRRGSPQSRGAQVGGQSVLRGQMVNTMHAAAEASCETNRSFNDAGITVGGSESHQHFSLVSGFPLESTSTVLVLKLRGEAAGKLVVAPVTVKARKVCEICGKSNKAPHKFCAHCGAALEMIA